MPNDPGTEPPRTDFSDGVRTLVNMRPRALLSWLKAGAKFHVYSPLPAPPTSLRPARVVDSVWDHVESLSIPPEVKISFQIRLQICTLALLRGWRPSDSRQYLCRLLEIAGRLEVFSTLDVEPLGRALYEELLQAALNGTLRNASDRDDHVHAMLLATLFRSETPPQYRGWLEKICRRWLDDANVSALCYRKLWEIDNQNGFDSLGRLVGTALVEPTVDLETALHQFLKVIQLRELRDGLPSILDELVALESRQLGTPRSGHSAIQLFLMAIATFAVSIQPVGFEEGVFLGDHEFAYHIAWRPRHGQSGDQYVEAKDCSSEVWEARERFAELFEEVLAEKRPRSDPPLGELAAQALRSADPGGEGGTL